VSEGGARGSGPEWGAVRRELRQRREVGGVVAIAGARVVTDYRGQTRYDNKVFNQTVFKFYHQAEILERVWALDQDGTVQYYDDFEIWSDFPPGY